ncbi:MAG: hypothetical protein ACLU4J_09705 [Butyricimonas paravirosa]
MNANLRFCLCSTDRSRSSEEMNTLSFNTGTDLGRFEELLKTSTLYPGKDPLLLMRRLNVSEARRKE